MDRIIYEIEDAARQAGEIIRMQLLIAGEDQARRIEKRFRKNAEKTYHQIVELLDGEER